MLALRELQMCFTAALLDKRGDLRAEIVADGVGADDRIAIYRNNVVEGFIKALAIGFPVIERLVGADYFRQLAGDFQRAHPSRHGDLHHIGQPFAAFLRARFAATEYAYLPDVAALEWAYQEAQIAADAPALAADAFGEVAPEQFESLRFVLHPACTLVRSEYPIVRIWFANQPEAEEGDLIDLHSGADHVIARRTASDIEFVRLSAGEFAALETLSIGGTLGEALEIAQAADSTFDLADALSRFVQLQLFTALSRNWS
jgi:uncharacterized protein